MKAVDEAITRTHGMPDELYSVRETLKLEQAAAGSEANLDAKFALLGLEELVPGALWKGNEHDINQAVAKAKNTTRQPPLNAMRRPESGPSRLESGRSKSIRRTRRPARSQAMRRPRSRRRLR